LKKIGVGQAAAPGWREARGVCRKGVLLVKKKISDDKSEDEKTFKWGRRGGRGRGQ